MTQLGQASSPTLERCIGALKLIDVMLTTAEGDNIPRGEAPKHHVRLLARQVLGWRGKEQTAADRGTLREIIGSLVHGYACGCDRPWPPNTNYEELAEAVLAGLVGEEH